ncbi:hypothetical protein Rsub_01855 [Raphidocelis subcapitata]|uniref:SET domain-containing protein n=1 Tax=Raphidocelis subcapitata TaxID=307507 RepID=A0A2V0NNJ1_9CHLO|nr:hypothetical protein Rsub_01855 [Raphidocelis subcapitata]|eukprot:GBF89138.1 hypothetical protein Rsub_01855 [Raphidocelis subcapitata]
MAQKRMLHVILVLAAAAAAATAPGAAATADAAAADIGGAAALAEGPTADELEFLAWLKKQGAEFNVELRTLNGVRGTYATKELKRGDVIAKVPLNAAFWAAVDGAEEELMKAAKDPAHPLAPYLRVTPTLRAPGPGEPRPAHASTIPREYMHLVGGAVAASRAADAQHAHAMFWAEHGLSLMRKGITAGDFKAAVVTVARAASFNYRGEEQVVLVPLLTMANPASGCPNWLSVQPCRAPPQKAPSPLDAPNAARDGADPSELCAVWSSGGAARAGAQLCASYGLARPDLVFFQYGSNLPASPPPPLALEDMANVDEVIGEDGGLDGTLLSGVFDGDLEELKEEHLRLSGLIEALEADFAVASATPAAAEDPGGAILQGMLQLWRVRAAAAAAERARIEARISEEVDEEEL